MHLKPCQGEQIQKISIEIQRDCHIFFCWFFCSFCLGFSVFWWSWVHLLFWGFFWYGFSDNSWFENKPEKAKNPGKQYIAPVFHHQLQKKNKNGGFETKQFQTILTLIFPLWFHCYFAEAFWNHLYLKRCWQALCCTHFCDFPFFGKTVQKKHILIIFFNLLISLH